MGFFISDPHYKCSTFSSGVFPKDCHGYIGVNNGWLIMENPIKIHDLGVHLFLETPI